jgi:hypothetical protein
MPVAGTAAVWNRFQNSLSYTRSHPLNSRAALLGSIFFTCLAACELDEPDDQGVAGTGNVAAVAGSGTGGGTGGATGGTGPNVGGAAAMGGTSGGGSGGGAGSLATGGTAGTGGSSAGAGGAGNGGAAGALAGAAGLGGTAGSAGNAAAGAAAGMAGSSATAGSNGGLGSGMMTGSGTSSERYETVEVSRNEVPYVLITNGWGPGFGSHTVSWEGTSFTVESMEGDAGSMGQPASYPSVFCGKYSVMQVPACGLPAELSSITSLRTGWRWAPNGNTGQYNAAYDIWLGNGTQLQGYLMVWLRDPTNFQPAGTLSMTHQAVTVANVPGVWNVWSGMVNRLPITNWVRAESTEDTEIEFDVMDFVRDAEMRGVSVPGTHVNAVAVGFEIWEGPVTNLESVDFYVEVN